MKIDAIKVEQNGYVFYIASLDSSYLKRTCSTNMKKIEESKDIYQRKLNINRVHQIAEFAKRPRALFPTCVVLNSRSHLDYDNENHTLFIPDVNDIFFIIDGQHRIAGINESNKEYKLGVVILNNVDIDTQSELFITINSEQKSVHPNIRFNMKSNDRFYTPEKMVRNIAEMLNGDQASPMKNCIWLDDSSRKKGEKPLSLSAFCEPLCAYIYNTKDYYSLKDKLYETNGDMQGLICFSEKYKNNILWPLYFNGREDVLYRIVYNYFKAIHDVYEKEWNDSSSVIIKTTGYNAFMILFKGIFQYCRAHDNLFSYNRMYEIFSANRIDGEFFYTPNVGVGRSGAYELYRKLLPKEIGDDGVDSEYMVSLSEDIETTFF